MPNLNAVSVPVAIEHKSKLDLSFDHVTTMGFMRSQPVLYRRMLQGEHDFIKCDSVVRPMPIEVPFFGSLVQNLRYFSVKLSQIFPNWYSFKSDTIASNSSYSSLVSGVPLLPNDQLVDMFTNAQYDYTNPTNDAPLFTRRFILASDSNYYTTSRGYLLYSESESDASVPVTNIDWVNRTYEAAGLTYSFDYYYSGAAYNYEMWGRRFLTVLRSLGYEVVYEHKSKLLYNCLNILAWVKVYTDWYANSQYLNSPAVLLFERLIKFNDPTSQLSLSHNDLCTLLLYVTSVVYDVDDYFNNAYDNPQAAVSGQFSGFSVFDPTLSGGAYLQTATNGTVEMVGDPNTPYSIGSTYIHEALKRLSDYQKRHQLSARNIDRILAEYGAVPNNLKMERSIYLGHQVNVIKSGAVMGTSAGSDGSGNTSSIGDYSGAGFGQSSDSIEYLSDDDCIILCISSIIPQGNIVQGYDRVNRAIDRFDFFVAENDFGIKAIEKGEVFVSPVETFNGQFSDGSSKYTGVFGFTGQYGELKRPKSFLTGDLSNTRIYQGANSWHLFRLFDENSFGNSIDNIVHSLSFTRGVDSAQYNRIFQYTNHDYDPFMCFMHFDFAAQAPCRPLFDTYDFDSSSGAKTVEISNGNKVN